MYNMNASTSNTLSDTLSDTINFIPKKTMNYNTYYLLLLNEFNRGQVIINKQNEINSIERIIKIIYNKATIDYSFNKLNIDDKYIKNDNIIQHIKQFFINEIDIENNDIKIDELCKDITILAQSYLLTTKYNKNNTSTISNKDVNIYPIHTKLSEPLRTIKDIKLPICIPDIGSLTPLELSSYSKQFNKISLPTQTTMNKYDGGIPFEINSDNNKNSNLACRVCGCGNNNGMYCYCYDPTRQQTNLNECLTKEINSFNEELGTNNYSYIANQWSSNEKTMSILKDIYIIFCHSQNISIIIPSNDIKNNDDINILKNINNYIKDLEFIECFEQISDAIIEQINNYFDCNSFDNIDEVKNKVKSFKLLNNITLPEQKTEKEYVIGYINQNYNISTNPEKKMKSSIIIDEINKGLKLFVQDKLSFAKRISSYLLELKLNKKRYSDGIYYYGIEPKVNSINLKKSSSEIELDYLERLKEYELKK